jgi:hypothetical protein
MAALVLPSVADAKDARHEAGHDEEGLVKLSYDLKKLFAASFEARFLVAAASKRSISDVSSAIRSFNSSTDNSDRSCPISWVTFFRGLSSSSMEAMGLLRVDQDIGWLPEETLLANQVPLKKF